MRVPHLTFLLVLLTAWPVLAANPLVEELSIGVTSPIKIHHNKPPKGFVFDAELGLLRHQALQGQVVHTAGEGLRGLFETRAVRTFDRIGQVRIRNPKFQNVDHERIDERGDDIEFHAFL